MSVTAAWAPRSWATPAQTEAPPAPWHLAPPAPPTPLATVALLAPRAPAPPHAPLLARPAPAPVPLPAPPPRPGQPAQPERPAPVPNALPRCSRRGPPAAAGFGLPCPEGCVASGSPRRRPRGRSAALPRGGAAGCSALPPAEPPSLRPWRSVGREHSFRSRPAPTPSGSLPRGSRDPDFPPPTAPPAPPPRKLASAFYSSPRRPR
mmetsp:Transcript_77441/g.196793  ORF Transcript_77441/g.196793 Transcript_77441/m.196793 type:complete len:206 (-) Transcript_77441:581-1198(-)